jgi:lipopolysaccharide/colanic/teichoic acid biosynthesis glycosyltransferase
MSSAHIRRVDAVPPLRIPAWKRIEDLVVGIPLTLLASPFLAIIALAILAESGRPVFFVDDRVGLGGRPFHMIKFRTMVPNAIGKGLGRLAAVSDSRLTTVGAALRRWSADELPQVFNVLRGDMSIVGPRPTYQEQVARYTPRDRGRLKVKPGITGLAQVSGRNDLSWRERIDLDLAYVERLGPWLDLAIIVRTPVVVLRGIGLYGKSGVTPDYDGD